MDWAVIAAFFLPLLANAASAAPRPEALIGRWQGANEACRGYPGDDPRSVRGCADREALGRRIAASGWCFGRRGERGFQGQWHRCGPDSIRPE